MHFSVGRHEKYQIVIKKCLIYYAAKNELLSLEEFASLWFLNMVNASSWWTE